jgi:hypothetical protein
LVWTIIERVADGEAVGYLAHPWFAWRTVIPVVAYELKSGISWLDVTPSVVRHIWNVGKIICASEGQVCTAFTFGLAGSHPVYEVLRESLPRVRPPYCWYLRVPDLPGFIHHIAPVLERRLENSLMPGFSGAVRLSFYRSGLRLGFEHGKLTLAEAWQPGQGKDSGEAAFPNLTFLQLLFGHRTLDELKQSYADCWWNGDRERLLLGALFPKKFSSILGIV